MEISSGTNFCGVNFCLDSETQFVSLTIPRGVAFLKTNIAASFDLFFPDCHSGKFLAFITPMFSFTINTGLSFAGLRNFGQVIRIGEQRFSSCHGHPDLGRHLGLVAITISTVTLNTTLSFCIFPVCDVSI